MLEDHHPDPANLIFHGGQRFVLSGHSQSVQLPGLGIFLSFLSFADLPTAIKAQLQEEGILSPHKGWTSSAQLGQ